MAVRFLVRYAAVVGLAAAFLSCQKAATNDEQKPVAATLTSQPAGQSLANQVGRRRALQLRNSLSKILVLDRNGMCLELNKFPCIDTIHRANLGSMDAYNASQYQHPTNLYAGTPGSFERVVLAACMMRAGLDLNNPSQAVIFKDIKMSRDGRLEEDPAIDRAIVTLYRRALTREPTATETADLRAMYEEIFKEEPIAAGLNWMTLSCFAVLTSLEMAFY